MSHLVRIGIFTLAVIGFYTYFANSIPQIESQPPEEITSLSAEMTPEELAGIGQKIVEGKGGCLVCHGVGSPGPRAPDLAGVGLRSATRVEGLSSEEYLRQSLVEPTVYVVEGFEPIMPKIDAPPVSLTAAEITAVIAYLQSLGGEITVRASAGEMAASPTQAPQAATAASPEALIAQFQCGVCHVIPGVEGAQGQVGPSLAGLSDRAATRVEGLSAEEYIRQSILEPNAFVVSECPAGPCAPGVMPATFKDQLTEEQLATLVTFLANLKGQ
jgi:mono/diheme cytochrome c family protein